MLYNILFFQIFSLLIYLEIIELNLFGLNKNTRGKIKARANEDLNERMDTFFGNTFEFTDGYILDDKEDPQNKSRTFTVELEKIKDDRTTKIGENNE